jgi:hypothetical protein
MADHPGGGTASKMSAMVAPAKLPFPTILGGRSHSGESDRIDTKIDGIVTKDVQVRRSRRGKIRLDRFLRKS